MNKDYELSKDEQQVLDDYEAGEFKSTSDLKVRQKALQTYARHTLNKTKNINIRLSERDLYRLKAKAIEEGIPYQTLASSILHKSTANK